MVGMYKARGAKEYFNSLPDDLLDKNVVVSINSPPESDLCTINRIMVADNKKDGPYNLLDFVHIPSMSKKVELEEIRKETSKEMEGALDKARELFERYYNMLIEHTINNNRPIEPKWIKDKAIELTRNHKNGLYELGNNPWDPR